MLEERNNSWPEPPGGFSPKHILGPESDYPRKTNNSKNKKKRRRDSDGDVGGAGNDSKNRNKKRGSDKRKRGNNHGEDGDINPESKLSRGLSSSRAGFSVEEMEAERARKKAKA